MKGKVTILVLLALFILPIVFSSPYVNLSATSCTEGSNSMIEVNVSEGLDIDSVTLSVVDSNSLLSEKSSKVVFLYGFKFKGTSSLDQTLKPFNGNWSCYGVRIENQTFLSEPLTYVLSGEENPQLGVAGEVNGVKKVAMFNLDDGGYSGIQGPDGSLEGGFEPIYYSSQKSGGEALDQSFDLTDPSISLDTFELPKGNYTISVTLTTASGEHYSEVDSLNVLRDSEDFDREKQEVTEDSSSDRNTLIYSMLALVVSLSVITWFVWRDFKK